MRTKKEPSKIVSQDAQGEMHEWTQEDGSPLRVMVLAHVMEFNFRDGPKREVYMRMERAAAGEPFRPVETEPAGSKV